jgi:hypothetical protein
MRSVLALGVVLLLFAAPAFAGDGNVPQGTLSSLGLGGMQVVSDAQGMQVRGMSCSFGMVTGTSFISGLLLTPDTKSFIVGSSVNEVDADAEKVGHGTLKLFKAHGVSLDLGLAVAYPDLTTFEGSLAGSAGGWGKVKVGSW